jgi:hypothetical protein
VLNPLDARRPVVARSDVARREDFGPQYGLDFPAVVEHRGGSIARGARASIRSTPGHISGE